MCRVWVGQKKSGPPGNTEAIWNAARKLDTVTSAATIAATEMHAVMNRHTMS